MQARPHPRQAPWVWWALGGALLAWAAVGLWTDPLDGAASPSSSNLQGVGGYAGAPGSSPLPAGLQSPWPRPRPWSGPVFAPASRDPFTFQAVKVRADLRARVAVAPTVPGPPLDATVPSPAPASPPPHPRLRFLGRVLGHDGVASIYMADDGAGVAVHRSPEPVALGQVVGSGYRVVAVGDRQIGLAHPGSDTRVHIDLPDWPGVAPTEERAR